MVFPPKLKKVEEQLTYVSPPNLATASPCCVRRPFWWFFFINKFLGLPGVFTVPVSGRAWRRLNIFPPCSHEQTTVRHTPFGAVSGLKSWDHPNVWFCAFQGLVADTEEIFVKDSHIEDICHLDVLWHLPNSLWHLAHAAVTGFKVSCWWQADHGGR